MKKFFALLPLALAALAGRAALPQPDLIAQIHFAGAQKIAADQNAAAFTNEFGSAEALALRQQTADKLAPWLAGWLQAKLGTAVPDGAARLRPLFDDLQAAEWFLEARAGANDRPDVAIAIRLEGARAAAWPAALKPFFPAATFQPVNGWLIFDSGTGAQKVGERLARKISAPPAGWLAADVSWPRLAQWYPQLKELALPETQLQVTAPDANLHLDGKFFFPENLSLTADRWQFPMNTVHQPFISLTAVRGISGWLQAQSWARPYLVTPVPNQLFTWGLAQIPYQAFAAAPFADAAGALAQLQARLAPVFNPENSPGKFMTPLMLEQTNSEIRLTGIPFVGPYVQAVREPAGQFLMLGGFPNTPRGKQPLPPELFQRLATSNLLFYHWEITAERMPQILNLSQLTLLMTLRQQLGGETAAMKLIQKITPALGNTVTEVTQTGPAEMTFTRKAPGAFTAMELFLLGSWLEAKDFPHFTLKMPPRPKGPLRLRPPGASGAPANQPVHDVKPARAPKAGASTPE